MIKRVYLDDEALVAGYKRGCNGVVRKGRKSDQIDKIGVSLPIYWVTWVIRCTIMEEHND